MKLHCQRFFYTIWFVVVSFKIVWAFPLSNLRPYCRVGSATSVLSPLLSSSSSIRRSGKRHHLLNQICSNERSMVPTATIVKRRDVSSIQNCRPNHFNRRFSTGLFQSPSSIASQQTQSSLISASNVQSELSPAMSFIVKMGMISFILGMCITLPLTLYPQKLLYKLKLITRLQKERWALTTGQYCARTLLRLIPFCSIETIVSSEDGSDVYDATNPKPTIWVCNHTSMLDVFVLLACDHKLRGRKRRPMKIVYWKNLESNPITKLLFRQCGFIPVAMAANAPGEDNEYDISSFKQLLKDVKAAFVEDFDVALLPEGQLNPTPEKGLLPIFSGAYTLAKMSKRPIHMIALHGIYKLWHPNPDIDMNVTGRNVKVRIYPNSRTYTSANEFISTFQHVVGTFGTTGKDLPSNELDGWLTGQAWKQIQQQEKEQQEQE